MGAIPEVSSVLSELPLQERERKEDEQFDIACSLCSLMEENVSIPTVGKAAIVSEIAAEANEAGIEILPVLFDTVKPQVEHLTGKPNAQWGKEECAVFNDLLFKTIFSLKQEDQMWSTGIVALYWALVNKWGCVAVDAAADAVFC